MKYWTVFGLSPGTKPARTESLEQDEIDNWFELFHRTIQGFLLANQMHWERTRQLDNRVRFYLAACDSRRCDNVPYSVDLFK